MGFHEHEQLIHEDARLKVAAEFRRDCGTDEAGPSSILICGGDLKEVMGSIHENVLRKSTRK